MPVVVPHNEVKPVDKRLKFINSMMHQLAVVVVVVVIKVAAVVAVVVLVVVVLPVAVTDNEIQSVDKNLNSSTT